MSDLGFALGLAFSAVVSIRLLRAGRGQRTVVGLTFPRDVRADQAVAALRALTGLLPPWWRRIFGPPSVVLEVRGTPVGIEHLLGLPASRAQFVTGALRAAIPGIRISDTGEEAHSPKPLLARELRLIGTGRLRTEAAVATNANLLAALQPLRRGESIVFQYVIAPRGTSAERALERLETALFGASEQKAERPSEPVLTVALRVGVVARGRRAAQLMAQALGSFHPAGTQDARLGRRLLPSFLAAHRVARQADPDFGASAFNADEVAAVLAVPLQAPRLVGLSLAGSSDLPVAAGIPRDGLVLGDSTMDSRRPVAISFDEARRGVLITAPTGGGKTTLLSNITDALVERGVGIAVFDSKGDYADETLDRLPKRRWGDVVVFDPADEKPCGFNLIGGSEEAELIVDHVVGQFRSRYGAAGLGARSEDILRAALTTLTGAGSYTLCEVQPLLTNSSFRQRLIGRISDPVLEGFWGWFSNLSEAARAEVVGPIANKIRSYTLRPRVRTVIGQTDGLDFTDVLARGRIAVIALRKGLIGEDAASLIGAAMTARLWAAIQGRASLPGARRRPFMVVCDEFQDFAALPLSFADAVAQSRGYGVGWVLAHQHLDQLDKGTRQAVLANCRTRLAMQLTASDAATFARELGGDLERSDFQSLGPYEAYAAVSTGAAVAPPASIRTRPAPPALGSTAAVRQESRARYGRSADEVDEAIRKRVGQLPPMPVGGIRRAP